MDRVIDTEMLKKSLENAQNEGSWKRANMNTHEQTSPPPPDASVKHGVVENTNVPKTHEQNMEFFHNAVNEYEERNKNTPPALEPQVPGVPTNSAEIELEKIDPPRKGLIARIMGMFSPSEKVEPTNDIPSQEEIVQPQEPIQMPNPGARIVGTPESDARNYLKKPTPPRGSTG